MKFSFFLQAAVTLLCWGHGISAAHPQSEDEIIPFDLLTEEQLNTFYRGNDPELTLFFPTGAQFPINLLLWGDFLSIALEDSEKLPTIFLKVQNDFFVRSYRGAFLFSTDLVTWRVIDEFIYTHTRLGLRIEQGLPTIVMGIEINERDPSDIPETVGDIIYVEDEEDDDGFWEDSWGDNWEGEWNDDERFS